MLALRGASLVCIAALAACETTTPQPQLTPEERVRLCTQARDDKAIADCTAIITARDVSDPLLARAYVRRAAARMSSRLGRSVLRPLVLADLDAAIALDPRFQPAYFLRGQARDAEADYAGAIADYSETIRLNPKHSEAYNNRGCARNSLGQFDEAIADLEAAIALNPRARAANLNRGFMAVGEGRFLKAYGHFIDATRASGPGDLDQAMKALSDYVMLWSTVALARSGALDARERAHADLTRYAERAGRDPNRPLVEYYLEKLGEPALRARMPAESSCDVDYFVAQRHLILGDAQRGLELLRRVSENCPPNHHEQWAARLELRRIAPK